MKKLLSILGSIFLGATTAMTVVSCGSSEWSGTTVEAKVENLNKDILFTTSLSLAKNTDISNLSNEYGLSYEGQWYGSGSTVNLKSPSDAKKFGKDKGKDKVTVDVLVTFHNYGKFKQSETYSLFFGKLGTDKNGYNKVDKKIAKVSFTMPKQLVLSSAKINSSLQEITVQGENLLMDKSKAQWSLRSLPGQPDVPKGITVSSMGGTNKQVKLKLSVGLTYVQKTSQYQVRCYEEGVFDSITTLTVSNNSTAVNFLSASINYSADKASSFPGQVITVFGDNLDRISKDDISKFSLTSKKSALPDNEKIEWMPKGSPLINTENVIYLWLTQPVTNPDTYTIHFGALTSANFIVPDKEPKLVDTPVINDQKDQVTITGENLDDNEISHWSIREQSGNIPNGLDISIDSSSTDTKLIFNLSQPLKNGWYYIHWEVEGDLSQDSSLFEVSDKGNTWKIPDNAKLNSGSFVFGDGIYIEIYTSKIPDNNDCTSFVTADGKPVKKAQEQAGILKVWLASPLEDGKTVKISLKVSDTKTLSTSVTND